MENTKNGKTVNKALLMGTALISLSAVQVKEAQAVTQTLAMSAAILEPLVVATVTSLNFGDLTVGTGGGTAVIATGGGRSVTGGATGVAAIPSDVGQAGQFSITGEPSAMITVALAAGPFTVVDGANNMAVATFVMATTVGAADPLAAAFALPTDGDVNVDVGATLTVPASQPVGNYAGTYTVDVNYM